MVMQEAIRSLIDGHRIAADEAAAAVEVMMSGEATPAQMGAFLALMRAFGETPDVIAACLGVTQRHAEAVPVDNVIDIVGTGADGMDTVNVSTTAALVVAGAGVRVAKHGNRAASSKCGSADVLEALGGRLDIDGRHAARIVERCGFVFLFAQRFHPAFRHVGGPRREIGGRTLFNILGPLTNPARPRAMLVGVSLESLGPLMAEAFRLRGMPRAMLVHSAEGLDEISPAGVTHAWILDGDAIREVQVTPADFGLPAHPIQTVVGGDAHHNAGAIHAVLDGGEGPVTDFVLMNAAAALYVAGAAPDFKAGVKLARESIASGRAREVLDQYISLSNEVGDG